MIPTQVHSDQNISGALTMSLSPDGTPWFTELFGGKVGKVNLGVPINLGLSIENATFNAPFNTGQAAILSPGENLTIALSLTSPSKETVTLGTFLSLLNYATNVMIPRAKDSNNATSGLVYSFSTPSGNGNFTSYLSIRDQNLAPGSYLVTISAMTTNIHVSKVIQIEVA